MDGGIVGRESELAAVMRLLDGVAEGPVVLALWGEAGIGKTTVWAAGVERARAAGFTTLTCQPAATEVRLSYAGLTDLLAETALEELESLPCPQRRALHAALLRGHEDDPAPDPRAVATGFLSVLSNLVETAPVLVAIDDIQWLDDPTHRVVEFAVRRCAGPVAALTARRVEHRVNSAEQPEAAEDLAPRDRSRGHTMWVEPLSPALLERMLRQKTGRALPRPAVARIAERSAGNPFFALELAHVVERNGSSTAVLPSSLQSLVANRLAPLGPQVCEALLIASSLTDPRVEFVQQVLDGTDAVALLGRAEDAGVIALNGGRTRFTHPLLAAGVYARATPTARRTLHRRLSRLVDDVEERARHLALAAVGADVETVAALDAAATHARRRGAPTGAAELLEHAMRLGAGDPTLRLKAAQDHFHANNPARARELLESAIPDLGPGTPRAEALMLLAVIGFDVDGDAESVELLERARQDAAGDPVLRCSITLELGYQVFSTGGPEAGRQHAVSAVEEAERLGDDGLLAEALAELAFGRFILGEGVDDSALARAVALEDPNRRTRANIWPTFLTALVRQRSHRLHEAAAGFAAARQRCLDQGREGELWFVSYPAISVACWAGDIATAQRYVDELVEHAHLVGTDQAHAIARTFQAQLWAWVGQIDAARDAAKQAMASFSPGVLGTFPRYAVTTLGVIELSVGDHERAAGWLAPAIGKALAAGFREPVLLPSVPDAVEALVAVGRLDGAEPLVELLEADGARPDRHWARAVGARCRALLLQAQDHADDAFETFKLALVAHDDLPQLRYDRARTLLALGQLQRRRKQRRAAQASLAEAARLFEQVQAAQWVRNARDELDRLGLRAGPSDQLTPTEQHVAQLAASGLTNREVATALFVSPKTIEAHLGRVYRKLGIRSRAELGRIMAQRT